MKWFLILTAAVAALLLLSVLVGMALPKEHVARADARVPGSPDAVWQAMTRPEAFPEWRPGVEEVEVLERNGRGAARWTERTEAGSMTLEVVEGDPTRRLVLRIADSELPFGGTWVCALEPEADGTRVRIVENGTIDNPVLRFVARFVLGYEARMRDYLAGLEERMEAETDGPPGRREDRGERR